MKTIDYNWDAYFAQATFKEIRSASPDLSTRGLPTIYSPDRSLIYLSSLGDYVETNDAVELKANLSILARQYHACDSRDHRKLYLTELDFTEVSLLLFGLEGDEAGYGDPIRLLLTSLEFHRHQEKELSGERA
jgi:hypothetical protein